MKKKMMVWLRNLSMFLFVLSRIGGCPLKCRCTSTVTYCMYKGITTEELEQLAPLIPESTVKLYLSGNKISSLPLEQFKHLQKLTYLSASFNQMKQLPQQIGDFLPKLKMLYLTANQINSITSKELNGYHDIEVLNLDQNKINEIEDFTFVKMPNLRELLLGQNSLSVITQNTFKGLGNLIKLQLNNNNINRLDVGSFKYTPNLQQIFLNVNKLTMIQSNLFSGVRNLRILYLNDNFIDKVEKGAFRKLEIDTIYLNMNRLIRLPIDLFKDTVIVGNVYLRDNPFVCDCILAFFIKQTSNRHLQFDKCSSPELMKGRRISDIVYDSLNCTLCHVFACPNGNRCAVNAITNNYTCTPLVEDLKEEKITNEKIIASGPPSFVLWIIAVICTLIFLAAIVILLMYIKNRRKRKAFEINRNVYEKVEGEKKAVLTGLIPKGSFNMATSSPTKLKQYFV